MSLLCPGGPSQSIWACTLGWWWDIRARSLCPSVSPQLFQCREVDSISSSATDWCVEMSCNTVSARYTAGNQGKPPFLPTNISFKNAGRFTHSVILTDYVSISFVYTACFAHLVIIIRMNFIMTHHKTRDYTWTVQTSLISKRKISAKGDFFDQFIATLFFNITPPMANRAPYCQSDITSKTWWHMASYLLSMLSYFCESFSWVNKKAGLKVSIHL